MPIGRGEELLSKVLKPKTSSRRRAAHADIGRASEVEEIVDRCVQCGLCNPACPTYVIERDERDGPRGRIAMIGDMFSQGSAPTESVRFHVGRCISCMACATVCPAGVDYGRLVGHAKAFIRETTVPSVRERILNWFSGAIIPHPDRLRWLVRTAPILSRVGRWLRWVRLKELATMADAAPGLSGGRAAFSGPGTAETKRDRRARVILLAGCAQQILRPDINDATIRLLARSGVDVEVSAGAGCCGAVAAQAGDEESARNFARANIDAWSKSVSRQPVDAILSNAAGCGFAVKDYPHLLRDDPAYADQAAEIASLARDVTEFIGEQGLGPPRRWSSLKIAYQAPCYLRHGQHVVEEPAKLIHDAGFTVVAMPEADMCCGAGGTYAYREPEIADSLRTRKTQHILAIRPDVVATGSLACLKHLEPATSTPIVHVVELLDWAHGGPVPRGLSALAGDVIEVPGPPPLDIEDYIRA